MKLMCRIEPIINLQTGQRIGGEVLCQPEGADPEMFFRSIPIDMLSRIVQDQITMGMPRQYYSNGVLFLNISIPLLINMVWLKSLLAMLPGPKALELDCQQSESFFPLLVQHIEEILTILRDFNTQLWLDDLYAQHIPLIAQLPFRFDGIKIDKHELWRLANSQDASAMTSLIKQAESLADNVLVEGVENEDQHHFVAGSEVRYAQGYLWPVDERESFVITLEQHDKYDGYQYEGNNHIG
ncbi:EAL domain-containing protein [Pseudocitrobacter cyperus]|uniref:EAL domain-containing protein n=1 Tax=Pseudocitrobacter cyperus TaxID=3112843 RepID=A0ABV0HHT5_9ENTR